MVQIHGEDPRGLTGPSVSPPVVGSALGGAAAVVTATWTADVVVDGELVGVSVTGGVLVSDGVGVGVTVSDGVGVGVTVSVGVTVGVGVGTLNGGQSPWPGCRNFHGFPVSGKGLA